MYDEKGRVTGKNNYSQNLIKISQFMATKNKY